MTRAIRHHYDDPLDLVWLRCARELGFDIARSGEVYASFDGLRRITLSTVDDFDPDDSLAQLIFHELCHALIAAPEGLTREDWGLDNTSERDLVQEHATHRLQAHLADRWGLRPLFAVTTQWRDYWDRLPRDPLAGDDPAAIIARAARQRADRDPWAGALRRAFSRTAEIADLARPGAAPDSLWAQVASRVHDRHHLGARLGPIGERCGTCAWAHAARADGAPNDDDTISLLRCEMLRVGTRRAPEVEAGWIACQHFEPRLDEHACSACGACCHRAFHLVPVGPDEPVLTLRPDLVTRDAGPGLGAGQPTSAGPSGLGAAPFYIDRPDGFCRALTSRAAPFRCSIYDIRPESCRDFALGGRNCLEARRRIGLSVRP